MTPLITPNGDGRYCVRWNDNGMMRNRLFATAADATRFHAMRTRQPATPALDALIRQWVAEVAPTTPTRARVDRTCRELIQPYFGDTPIESITPDQVRAWMDWLYRERRYSASTIRSHFCVLRAAMAWALDAQLVPVNPCTQVALPRVPRNQRAAALTRLKGSPLPARRAPGHFRDCGALADLRRAVSGDASAEEFSAFLRQLDVSRDLD